jgi:hypothetical protein
VSMCPFQSIRLLCMHGEPTCGMAYTQVASYSVTRESNTGTEEGRVAHHSQCYSRSDSIIHHDFVDLLETYNGIRCDNTRRPPQAPDPNSILLASNTCLGRGLHKLVLAGGSPFPSLWLRHPPAFTSLRYKHFCPAIPLNRSDRPCKAYCQAAAFETGKLDLGTPERRDRKFSNYAGITSSESETLFQYDETRWKDP